MHATAAPRRGTEVRNDTDIEARAWAQTDLLVRCSQVHAQPTRDWPRWAFAWSLVALAILLAVVDAAAPMLP